MLQEQVSFLLMFCAVVESCESEITPSRQKKKIYIKYLGIW